MNARRCVLPVAQVNCPASQFDFVARSRFRLHPKALNSQPSTFNSLVYHLSRLISRSEEVTPSTSTHYLYDGWNRIAEYTYDDTEYTLAKTFLWGLDMTETPQGAGGVGGLLCQVDFGSNTRHYPAYDLNGNVIAYFDSNGQPAAHFQYDPFGNLTVDWENNAANFPYRFSTKPQDPITGLYYYGYRWYDPVTGRWPSRDPIEEQGGINLYGFLNNNSVNFIDLLGLRHKVIRSGTKNYDEDFSVDLMNTLGIAADFKLKGAIFWQYVCCDGETSDSNMRKKNAYIVSTNKNGLALSAQGKYQLSIKDRIKENLKKSKHGKNFSAILDLMDIQSTVALGVEKGMVSFHYDGCNKKASKVNAGGIVSLNGDISANASLGLLKDYDVEGSSSISGKVTAGGKISGVMADSVVYVRLANPTVFVSGNWSAFVSGGKGEFYGQDGFSYDFVQNIYLGQGATQLFKFDVINASQK